MQPVLWIWNGSICGISSRDCSMFVLHADEWPCDVRLYMFVQRRFVSVALRWRSNAHTPSIIRAGTPFECGWMLNGQHPGHQLTYDTHTNTYVYEHYILVGFNSPEPPSYSCVWMCIQTHVNNSVTVHVSKQLFAFGCDLLNRNVCVDRLSSVPHCWTTTTHCELLYMLLDSSIFCKPFAIGITITWPNSYGRFGHHRLVYHLVANTDVEIPTLCILIFIFLMMIVCVILFFAIISQMRIQLLFHESMVNLKYSYISFIQYFVCNSNMLLYWKYCQPIFSNSIIPFHRNRSNSNNKQYFS